MIKKKLTKIDNDKKTEQNTDEEIVLEEDSSDISGKIKKLQNKIKWCEKERQEYLDGWQRSRADFVNREKTVVLEREKAVTKAQEDIFVKLFPILDSFDMAFLNKDAWEKLDKDWRIGVEQIYSQTKRIFEQEGIFEIENEREFNPDLHEPVNITEVEDESHDGQIITVVQKGYIKGDKVLRPTKVIIGKFK